jgi:hypothetical protein
VNSYIGAFYTQYTDTMSAKDLLRQLAAKDAELATKNADYCQGEAELTARRRSWLPGGADAAKEAGADCQGQVYSQMALRMLRSFGWNFNWLQWLRLIIPTRQWAGDIIKKLVDELDLNRCVTRVLGEVPNHWNIKQVVALEMAERCIDRRFEKGKKFAYGITFYTQYIYIR